MKYLLSILMLICLSVSAYCQDDKIVIGFNCQVEPPTMTLIEGEGNLYHYAGQFQKYRGIYYLFTDMSTVKITSSSKLYKGLKMMFNTYDDKSEWLLNDGSDMPEGNSAVITQKMIDEGGGAMFRWEERAHLLISASDRNKEDPKHTLFLIVLPMPPDDILFSEVIPSLKVDKDSCTISGNVTIYRTGRVVMDSIYVEGEEAPTVYRGQIGAKDTPYYRKGGYAQVDIQRSWLGEEELVLTVYYTKFNRDGSMTKEQQDITVALFKKSFFAKMWVGFSNWLHEDFINGLLFHIGVMVLLSLLVLGIVKHVRSKNGIVQAPSPKENNKIVEALERDNMQLKQRLMSKEKALADCEARLQNKIKEIDKLKTLTEVNIDKNLFVNKCNSLNDEIEKIRKELMDNPRMDSEKLREKLLTLEKIVEIKKSSNYKQ